MIDTEYADSRSDMNVLAKLRSIFENAAEGIFQVTLDGHILVANPAAARILGYGSPEELIAEVTDIRQLYVDPERRDELIHEVKTKGIVTGFEVQVRRKDGCVIWTSSNIRTLMDESGRIVGFVGMGVDITERRRAEDALRESEMRYRTLFERAGDAILILEAEGENAGKIIDANQAAAEMHGYTVNELLTLKITDLDTPDAAKETPDRIRRSLGGEWIKEEITHRKKDGTVFPVEISGGLIEFGNHKYILSFDRNITERKQAEEAIRSEYAFRKAIEDSTLAGVATVDLDGRQTYVNPAFCRMVGWTEEELLGAMPPFVYWPPDEMEIISDALQKTISGRAPHGGFELCFRRRNEERFDVLVFLSSLKDGQGRTTGWLAAVYDITERKRAEEALENYAIKLEDANRLKDLFTDIMRHDLLNPLGIIKTATEQILVAETRDERMCNTLQMIKRNADKLIDMIKSASMYAMLESAEKLERSKLDLSEIFREIANNFKSQLEEKNMKLEYISKSGCCVMANPMIDAVFSNLLGNAIKYSPPGRKIEVKVIEEKEHFKICVKDWGYGIRDEDKPKIFTRFQRVDKKGVKGTGLGLAIARRVVDLHGGKIWIEDNPEGGSVFYVEIPKA